MKSRIKKKIAAVREAEMVQPLQAPRQPIPAFLVEEAQLEARVADVFGRLPQYKTLFTPQEVAFALSRPERWVRERFKKNPHCFDTGNATKVYLSIPRVAVAEEIRKMYRSPMLRAS